MKKATVLVIDGGGRGSALVDKYAESPHVKKILAVPGNDLMKLTTDKFVQTYPNLKTTSISEILEICEKEKVGLVDVAQDNAIQVGLVDALLKRGIPTIGPTSAAGQIEWDKSWTREILKKAKIPQPDYQTFSDFNKGIKYVKSQPDHAWFIKASGLAEGKGALPAKTKKEAIEKINELTKFGDAAKTFLVEEWLAGEEFSAFAVSDGSTYQLIGYAQDHKRANDFDEGENTGGMGCSAPPLAMTKEVMKRVEKIMKSTLDQLRRLGRIYKGILYLGGMILKEEVYVIEFNARWGDPEAQVLIPSIKTDFFEIASAVSHGYLDKIKIRLDNKSRVVVTGSSKGYPENYQDVKGKEIIGLKSVQKTPDVVFYSAGVKEKNGRYYANGGRLFYIVGEGKNVAEARAKAYGAISTITVEGNNLHYRTDIGWRDMARFEKDRGK